MKRLTLVGALCAALVAAPFAAQAPPEKDMTFCEGFVAGLVLGVTADVLIVVGYRCYKRWQAGQTNQPPVLPPLPGTNQPPVTNLVPALVLHGGDAFSWSRCTVLPYTAEGAAVVQAARDARGPYRDVVTLVLWEVNAGQAAASVLLDPEGLPVATNSLDFRPYLQSGDRFFRLRSP